MTLDLLDWRRRTTALYAAVRNASDPEAGWRLWCEDRERMIAGHPQSPLSDAARSSFEGLRFFEYDPRARVHAIFEPAVHQHLTVVTSGNEPMGMTGFATVHFTLLGHDVTLGAFWLDGYAGGLFISFGDGTNGSETYGAGRYLFDTAKGADLGSENGALILDFNFAYNPSCAYDPKWVCPLAPPANRLDFRVEAGEKVPA